MSNIIPDLFFCLTGQNSSVFLAAESGRQPANRPRKTQHHSRPLNRSRHPTRFQTPSAASPPRAPPPPAAQTRSGPHPTSTEDVVTIFFFCAGGFGKLFTHTGSCHHLHKIYAQKSRSSTMNCSIKVFSLSHWIQCLNIYLYYKQCHNLSYIIQKSDKIKTNIVQIMN